jgi:hypothetical protein
MSRSKIAMGTLLATLAMLVEACGGGSDSPPASASSALPDASPTTTSSGRPSGSPGEERPSDLVHLEMDGDVELEAELTTLISAITEPPPGGFALVWTGEGEDATTVGLGGSSFIGVEPTSATLVLTIATSTAAGVSTWVSSAGECVVTMTVAEPTRFAGSFSCRDLRSDAGEVVDVSGRFEATG